MRTDCLATSIEHRAYRDVITTGVSTRWSRGHKYAPLLKRYDCTNMGNEVYCLGVQV